MTNVKVKIKKLSDDAVIPKYALDGDAGMDMTAISWDYYNTPDCADCFVYHTGIAMEIPEGYVGLLFPRSSNRKTNAYLANSVGIVDSNFRGEILFCYKPRTINEDIPYKAGDKIGQIIIMPYPKIEFEEVNELSASTRGENGFGSTGS